VQSSAIAVFRAAQCPAVHADGRRCTWVYETTNETELSLLTGAGRADEDAVITRLWWGGSGRQPRAGLSYQGMASRSHFTVDEARAAGERSR